MTGEGGFVARALTDQADRLVSADEPLAGLQLRCGGEIPGKIAIPLLLEVVRKSRRYQMKLGRTMTAQDQQDRFSAFVEVQPRADGEPGCEVALVNWRSTAVPPEDETQQAMRRTEIDRHVAELWALLDRDQKLLAVQGDAPDIAGVVSAMQEGIGKPWTDFIGVKGMNHLQPMHWRLLDDTRVRVDGSERTWRANIVPRSASSGEPDGFELLLVANEPPPQTNISRGNTMKGNPVTGPGLVGKDVAPVLRQPISRIIANAESIRTRLSGPISDDYADYASEIASAGQHLLGLLDDLSDLEIVESDEFVTAPDRIDLADVARQAAGILGVRAKEADITIDLPKHDESLPVIAEFRRVLQILLNLVGNAIRYSPAESEIWIRLEALPEHARIIVADQGPGISHDDAQRVFDKFERLGRGGDGGSGLGLYISRRLARAMGGELSVESALGSGARFILDLPPAPDISGATPPVQE